MASLTYDMRWCVLAHLPAREIVVCRLVSREWRDTVDRATQEDWKSWYHLQVCDDLCVGDDFDWRRAAVCASSTRRALVAVCLWKARRPLRVEVPWRDDGGASLRRGVVRKIVGVTHIEFVYDNAFWLRALHRSCLRRHAVPACRNCQSKRKCLPGAGVDISQLPSELSWCVVSSMDIVGAQMDCARADRVIPPTLRANAGTGTGSSGAQNGSLVREDHSTAPLQAEGWRDPQHAVAARPRYKQEKRPPCAAS